MPGTGRVCPISMCNGARSQTARSGRRTWGEQNTETEAVEQLNWAVNHGNINFIDTAELYPVAPTSCSAGMRSPFGGAHSVPVRE
jgi:hypothetical protein